MSDVSVCPLHARGERWHATQLEGMEAMSWQHMAQRGQLGEGQTSSCSLLCRHPAAGPCMAPHYHCVSTATLLSRHTACP